MKLFGNILLFQLFANLALGQSTDTLQKDEIQKILEQQLFPGSKIDKNFHFRFPEVFSELNFKTRDGDNLNGLLFKSKQSKGLIFYLHGSYGALDTWGKIAPVYTAHNYDKTKLRNCPANTLYYSEKIL